MSRADVPFQRLLQGGLNTLNNEVNTPAEDCTVALNVDVDVRGVLKRAGTDLRLKLPSGTLLAPFFFRSNGQIPLLAVVVGVDIRLYYVNPTSYDLTVVRTWVNVYKTAPKSPSFCLLTGSVLRVLVVASNAPPIQIRLDEWSGVSPQAGFIDLESAFPFGATDAANKYLATTTYVNNVLVTAVISSQPSAVRATHASIALGSSVVLSVASLQWWAESELWRGDNFLAVSPRFHSSPADGAVPVPDTVLVDLPSTATPPYGLYLSPVPLGFFVQVLGTYTDRYTLNTTITPRDYTEYSFSDGTYIDQKGYIASLTNAKLFPTPFYVTFGTARPYLKNTFLLHPNVQANAVIRIPLHGYGNGDKVELTTYCADGFNTVSPALPSFGFGNPIIFNWVKVIDENTIQLFSDTTLTTVSTSFARANVFTVALVGTAPNQQITITGGVTTPTLALIKDGTGIYHAQINGSISNIANGSTNYLRRVGASPANLWELYYDSALLLRNGTLGTVTGTGGVFLPITLELGIRRQTLDNVYFARSRTPLFNGGRGISFGTNLSIYRRETNVEIPLSLNYSSSTPPNQQYAVAFVDNAFTLATVVSIGSARSLYVHPLNISGTTDSNARIVVVNTERRHVGTACTATFLGDVNAMTYAQMNGAIAPAYGLGRFADYGSGSYPTSACLHQGRLCLTGFPSKPSKVIFSSAGDSFSRDEFYNYFQIFNNTTVGVADPFDLDLGDEFNSQIVACKNWQQFVFVFTAEAVYRVVANSQAERAVTFVSAIGALNNKSVCATERLIYYLSPKGLYAIPLVDAGEYRSGEVSVKIGNTLPRLLDSNSSVVYSSTTDSLYVAAGNKIYRYSTRYDNWVVMESCVSFGTTFSTSVLKRVMFSTSNKLGSCLITTDSPYSIDYAERPSVLTTPTTTAATAYVPLDPKQPFQTVPFPVSSILSLQDLAVWTRTGGVYTALTFGVNYRKSPNNEIELLSVSSLATEIIYAPLSSDSWFGSVIALNGYQQPINYGAITLSNSALTYSFNLVGGSLATALAAKGFTLGTGNMSDIRQGYSYTSEYVSPSVVSDLLDLYKTVESISCLLKTNDIKSYSDAICPGIVLGNPFNFSAGIRLGVRVSSHREILGTYLLSLTDLTYSDDMVLVRERLQLNGWMFRLAVHSNDSNSFALLGWGFNIEVGYETGQISGGR